MKNFWVSWYSSDTPWTLHSPWWISGTRHVANRLAFDEGWDQPIICAAIRANDKQHAADLIADAHDTRPTDLEWRFLDERPNEWMPFSERFPRAAWMEWPVADAGPVNE